MIFGLGAALGWGFADLCAAFSSRRLGALTTVVIAQAVGALAITAILLTDGGGLGGLGSVAGWLLPISLVTAAAYLTLYRALQIGPVAVVSPVLASYAVVPVLLAVVLLGESLSGIQVAGAVVTIGGAVLTSTDLRRLPAGTARMPPGLPWAVASAVLFGVATYTLGWGSQLAGWLPTLWLARCSTAAVLVLVALGAMAFAGKRPPASLGIRAAGLAIVLGVVDLGGTLSYTVGAERGLVAVVTAVSATYPLIPVFGSVILLGERPAPNQYLGVAMVIGGLLLLAAA